MRRCTNKQRKQTPIVKATSWGIYTHTCAEDTGMCTGSAMPHLRCGWNGHVMYSSRCKQFTGHFLVSMVTVRLNIQLLIQLSFIFFINQIKSITVFVVVQQSALFHLILWDWYSFKKKENSWKNRDFPMSPTHRANPIPCWHCVYQQREGWEGGYK